MKLYELAGDYRRLQDLAEEGEDLGDALACLQDSIELKALNVCRVIAQLEADAAAADRESTRLRTRTATAIGQADRLRAYLRECMRATGITKIKGPEFAISLSEGKPRVEITKIEDVPAEYLRTKTTCEPDKVRILEAYKVNGECVPGCEIVPTTTLRIR